MQLLLHFAKVCLIKTKKTNRTAFVLHLRGYYVLIKKDFWGVTDGIIKWAEVHGECL